jgi:hypothetical protein
MLGTVQNVRFIMAKIERIMCSSVNYIVIPEMFDWSIGLPKNLAFLEKEFFKFFQYLAIKFVKQYEGLTHKIQHSILKINEKWNQAVINRICAKLYWTVRKHFEQKDIKDKTLEGTVTFV